MDAVVTVHLADLPLGDALRRLRRAPRPGEIDGLVQAEVATALPLRRATIPSLGLRRVGLIAFWAHRAAADGFAAAHPLVRSFAGGWRATLEPIRAFGHWPGLPESVPRGRRTDYEGASVVLTLGRLRLPRAVRFIRTSTPAEAAALDAPGFRWGTALARPPFVATCSLWESTAALSDYAYGSETDGHPSAIAADRAKPFHHRSAFIRFRPLEVDGALQGRNPLAADALRPGLPT